MYSNQQIGGTVIGTDGQDIDRGWTLKSEIFDKLEISNEDIFMISFENLAGFGIVEVGGRGFGGSTIEFTDKREVGLTALGTAFVKACSS